MITLYERWREVADLNGGMVALRDLEEDGQWTFRELWAAGEQRGETPDRVIFPRGGTADFILSVLGAWRRGAVLCPLENGQAFPKIQGELPVGTVHLKATSATTGAPRLVAFTAGQLMADARNIVATMQLRPDWPNIGAISLAHSYGFSNLVLPLLLHGIPLILAGSPLPEAVRRAAEAESQCTLPGVPALWRAWHESGAIPASVRLAISAGATLPLALEQRVFDERGLKIHNFYGSSECGGIAYDASSTPRVEDSCVGTPMGNVQLSVAGDGCLEVRGEAVGETYWPEPAEELGGGIFRTQDLAELRGREVRLRGRVGDRINAAGKKVFPEEIEKILATHPRVRACLVFGVPSSEDGRGETIVCCLAAEGEPVGEPFKHFLLEQLPAWQVPRDWWFVKSLAPNERGKFSRAEWRKKYLEANRGPGGS